MEGADSGTEGCGGGSTEARADALAGSIHFVDPNAYGNGWEYNQHQLRRRQYLDQLKKQLAEQKKKLENI